MESHYLYEVVSLLKSEKGIDCSGYRFPILERRIQKRVDFIGLENVKDYYNFLKNNPGEFDNLLDVLLLNVSHFFRNALSFEVLRKRIIPDVLTQKKNQNENQIRVWSAGCSNGEEPYSLAILLKEILCKNSKDFEVNIFATDVDKTSLEKAKAGEYKPHLLQNVKLGVLNKYFSRGEENYLLNEEIRKMVNFSFFDLMEKKNSFPAESIYGGFDIVLCRNVLIYFDIDAQTFIFNKLYKSLNNNGFLVLGEAEAPINEFKRKFLRADEYCKIYKKRSF